MLGIAGTVPEEDFPLVRGEALLNGDTITLCGRTVHVNRGTPALIAAAVQTARVLGHPGPTAFLVGDVGLGKGSRRLYHCLTEELPRSHFDTLTLHYLQPILHWHEKLQGVLRNLHQQPRLIADAGFMYAAKMSGMSSLYDLFTPDVGELAFLADEQAPHPFYTRGFILHDENRVPDLIARAYAHGNAARHLIVKGRRDYLAQGGGIIATVDDPVEEALEAMGGTGDTLTGIVSALIDAAVPMEKAAVIAMKANRLAGSLTRPTPATQIAEFIEHIPAAVGQALMEVRK
ncbi:MAG: sugar kinase [Deltaproteobacteria bacterium]|nr:sugar kinase [Deltaproteobacteria bacterium]